MIDGGHGGPAGVPGARSGLPTRHCHLEELYILLTQARLLLCGGGADRCYGGGTSSEL